MQTIPQSRRQFLKGTSAAIGGALIAGKGFGLAAPAAPKQRRPNILVVMTDQQNIDTIAAYRNIFNHPAHGTGWVKTPHLDRLAGRGLNFIESHSPSPVCGPGRACLWTGRMPVENGVVHNNLGIAKGVPNLGEWLEEKAGYRNFFCGKWHASGPWNYPHVSGPRKLPGFTTIPVGGSPAGDYNDYSVSASCSAFLREYRDPDPFFYVASLMNPHDICYWIEPLGGEMINRSRDYYGLGDALPPLPPNQDYDFPDWEPFRRNTAWTDAEWRNYAYDYYRMIEKVDADVGRILDALDERDDETLIVFTSDHGEGLGRHRRVQKWHPFEESVKVPLIIAGAGVRERAAFDTKHLVSLLDVSATACDAAGVDPLPKSQGRSLLPLVRGDRVDDWRESVCCDFQITGRVLRTARYKYVKVYEKRGGRQNGKWFVGPDGEAVRFDPANIRDCKVDPLHYLFDMQEDPWETKNLVGDSTYDGIIRDHDKLLYDQWEKHWEFNLHHTVRA